MKTGKRYAEIAKFVDRTTLYDPSEAVKLVVATGKAKFDETVRASRTPGRRFTSC